MLSAFIRLKERNCKAKLTEKKTENGSTYKTNDVSHQHVIDVRDKLVKERLDKAKESAKMTTKPTRELYADALAGAEEEIIPHMPKSGAFNKMMQNIRKDDRPVSPKTLDELVLPEVFTKSGKFYVEIGAVVGAEKSPPLRTLVFIPQFNS